MSFIKIIFFRALNFLIHVCFRAALGFYIFVLKLACRLRPRRPLPKGEPVDILMTGTFLSDNWIRSLLLPLALSNRCARIRFVSSKQLPLMPKVEPIYPSRLLERLMGRTPARLATFFWVGVHTSPHIVGGLHLLLNGLVAILLARLTGATALYNCCGGPWECEGGGYKSENRLFCKLGSPDLVVERFLLSAISASNLVITRGNLAIRFFLGHGVKTRFYVVTGGMDSRKFYPSNTPAEYDIITVGNLVPRKRVDLFLKIISKVAIFLPNIRAVVLGDGALLESLKSYAQELNILHIVKFAGHQNDVASWLQKAKIFLLPSESEGLSQAMIQAMLCGLPAVVSHVGEAEDLVKNGVNGFMVRERDVDVFVEPIIRLLEDQAMLFNFGKAARKSAERCDIHHLARKWDEILCELAE